MKFSCIKKWHFILIEDEWQVSLVGSFRQGSQVDIMIPDGRFFHRMFFIIGL